MLRRLPFLVSAALLAIFLQALPAAAENGKCLRFDPLHTNCLVWAQVPGDDGNNDSTDDDTGTGNVSTSKCVFFDGVEIPCTYNGATYNAKYSCYMRKITPELEKTLPILQAQRAQNPGKSPYLCQAVLDSNGGRPMIEVGEFMWIADGEIQIDPREAARRVLLSLGIQAIDIGLSPRLKGGANGQAYVGIPVWMWAANPTGKTIGPISAHNGSFGVLVTGQARLTEVAWKMGDGATIHCKGPNAAGKTYQESYGVTDSPACGHRYKKMSGTGQSGRYSISATSYWEFTWQAGGMQGVIPFNVTNNTTLPVGEIQVVVTDG